MNGEKKKVELHVIFRVKIKTKNLLFKYYLRE